MLKQMLGRLNRKVSLAAGPRSNKQPSKPGITNLPSQHLLRDYQFPAGMTDDVLTCIGWTDLLE